MVNNELIEHVVAEVLAVLQKYPQTRAVQSATAAEAAIADIACGPERGIPLVEAPLDREALLQMMTATAARIGVGRAGPRLKTRTLLTLRADHATAQDSVFADVSQDTLDELGLKTLQTLCEDRSQHLTRPDLGRQFSADTLQEMRQLYKQNVQVQIYVSDGLSSSAVEANVRDLLPVLLKGLEQYGISAGAPFFVKYGRVPAMDVISETIGSEVTCVLIGERPGLAAAESMSAYIAYRAKTDMPESCRTVVSNIYSGGISAVEAGAYIADVIRKMLELRISGVDLKL